MQTFLYSLNTNRSTLYNFFFSSHYMHIYNMLKLPSIINVTIAISSCTYAYAQTVYIKFIYSVLSLLLLSLYWSILENWLGEFKRNLCFAFKSTSCSNYYYYIYCYLNTEYTLYIYDWWREETMLNFHLFYLVFTLYVPYIYNNISRSSIINAYSKNWIVKKNDSADIKELSW